MVRRGSRAIAYIALGSNLNQPYQRLCQALNYIRWHVGEIRGLSDVVVSSPWDGSRQPPYFNLVAEVETLLTPMALLAMLQDIEKEMGRPVARPRWSARPIDLDILLYGEEVILLSALRVPHPGLYWRPFVLVPLLQVAPDLKDPVTGVPLKYFPGNNRDVLRTVVRASSLWTELRRSGQPERLGSSFSSPLFGES